MKKLKQVAGLFSSPEILLIMIVGPCCTSMVVLKVCETRTMYIADSRCICVLVGLW